MLLDIQGGDLRLTLADNELHDPLLERWTAQLIEQGHEIPVGAWGYNGIRELHHRCCPHSPVWLAFLNLEAISDGLIGCQSPEVWGDRSRFYEYYEPRRVPVSLLRLGAQRAGWRQNPLPYWGIETLVDARITPPHYVDLTFVFRCHRAVESEQLLYLVPSYLFAPSDPLMHFWTTGGQAATSDAERGLVYPCSAEQRQLLQGLASQALGELAPNTVLEYPCFWGRWRDLVIAQFHERADEVAFVSNPGLLQSWGGIAWDIQFLLRQPRPGRSYRHRMRLMVRPSLSAGQVLDEYHQWRRSLPTAS